MISSGDLPDAGAPPPYDASEQARSRKQMESQGSPGGGGAPGQTPTGAPPPPGGKNAPVQPAPERQPLTQEDMRPGGPVFMRPQFTPPPTWRAQLRTWAQHPESNVLRRLSQRADAQNQKPGAPPQQ